MKNNFLPAMPNNALTCHAAPGPTRPCLGCHAMTRLTWSRPNKPRLPRHA